MIKPVVTVRKTRSKTAKMRLVFQIDFPTADPAARRKACRLAAGLLEKVIPDRAERLALVEELRKAMPAPKKA